jgi:hypothetical protein
MRTTLDDIDFHAWRQAQVDALRGHAWSQFAITHR